MTSISRKRYLSSAAFWFLSWYSFYINQSLSYTYQSWESRFRVMEYLVQVPLDDILPLQILHLGNLILLPPQLNMHDPSNRALYPCNNPSILEHPYACFHHSLHLLLCYQPMLHLMPVLLLQCYTIQLTFLPPFFTVYDELNRSI
ncbi:hypothetical protein FGO68_gene11780 [Halteria grandinella]|uniref:Uncharacterized protein n=1 Tax=Halteria grandinella TaxID=5974 RepID=A0A8J8NPI5_HALGN|nr:hypothetical protein FGO68_gene11780 [Halteria grandinella]